VTAYAEAARSEPRRRRRATASRSTTTTRSRPRSTFGGIVWIVVVAVLLAGVVAVNVAVLRINVRLDRVSQKRIDLQADVARLQSALSSAGATAQISRDAQSRLALVQADPNSTRYLKLAP